MYKMILKAFILSMMVTLVLTVVNTSVLVVADETPAPTVNVTATVESTPVVTPYADYMVEFTINQESIYLENTIITGIVKDNTKAYRFEVSVNGIEYKTIIVPESEDGKFSIKLDFSDCSVGDEVTFTGYLAEGFSFPCIDSFHLERRPIKTPKKPAIKKIKKIGKGKVKVILKKVKNVSGYKVSCSTNKKFKGKGTKVKTAKTNTVVIKGLKAGKYFVKAQTYNVLKGSKTKYSKASRIKKCVIK